MRMLSFKLMILYMMMTLTIITLIDGIDADDTDDDVQTTSVYFVSPSHTDKDLANCRFNISHCCSLSQNSLVLQLQFQTAQPAGGTEKQEVNWNTKCMFICDNIWQFLKVRWRVQLLLSATAVHLNLQSHNTAQQCYEWLSVVGLEGKQRKYVRKGATD